MGCVISRHRHKAIRCARTWAQDTTRLTKAFADQVRDRTARDLRQRAALLEESLRALEQMDDLSCILAGTGLKAQQLRGTKRVLAVDEVVSELQTWRAEDLDRLAIRMGSAR